MLNAQWREAAIYRPGKRSPIAARIADQLRRRIVTGDIAAGQRMPPIRKLAALYSVSIPTVESAIHALVTLGLVRTRPGVGTFVAFPREQMTMLTYVWRTASAWELALVRAATDAWAAPLAAAEVSRRPRNRLPRRLAEINFLVQERSANRVGYPSTFLASDLDFHHAIAASLRGMEIGPTLYRQVGNRLMAPMMAVADVQAGDEELDAAHLKLASAILGGDLRAASRIARHVAITELESLQATLG